MRKLVGGREGICKSCGGRVAYIKIGNEIYTQCYDCGSLSKGKDKQTIKIFKEEYLYV